MNKTARVTPGQAKIIFSENPDKTVDEIAAMCGVGRSTYLRWKQNDFRDLIDKADQARQLANKRKTQQDILNKGKAASLVIEEQRLADRVEQIALYSDDNLIKKASRQMLITATALLQEAAIQGVTLIREDTNKAGAFLTAASSAIRAATESWETVLQLRARTFGTTPVEPVSASTDEEVTVPVDQPDPELDEMLAHFDDMRTHPTSQ